MAEEGKNATAETDKEGNSKSGGKKSILLLIVGLVMIVLAAVLVIFVIFPKFQQMNGSVPEEEVVEEVKEEPAKIGNILKIENITINPKGSLGRRFAVFEIALEYSNPELEPTLKTYMPIILDRYQTYLRTKTVRDLTSVTEIDSIRSDLKQIVVDMLKTDEVTNLYFTRFVLQ